MPNAVCCDKKTNQFWGRLLSRECPRKSFLKSKGQNMPKIRICLQSPDNQFVAEKDEHIVHKLYMLKLSKSMFDNVKHTV